MAWAIRPALADRPASQERGGGAVGGTRQRESGGQRGRGPAAAGSSAHTSPKETWMSLETLSFCTQSLKYLKEAEKRPKRLGRGLGHERDLACQGLRAGQDACRQGCSHRAGPEPFGPMAWGLVACGFLSWLASGLGH